MYFLARRFELLPRWLTEWPAAGGALSLTPAEAAYLGSTCRPERPRRIAPLP
jgi:hypothetical protein